MTDGSEIKERMTQYLEYKGYKPGWVEKHAILGNGYLRNTAGGYTATKLSSLKTVCTDLNLNWLITGMGDMIEVQTQELYNFHQAPDGGPQIGKVDKVEYASERRNFFDSISSVDTLESVDLKRVPKKYQELVASIKNRRNEEDELRERIKQLKDELRSLEEENRNLHRELVDAKNQTIELLMNAQKA